MYQVHIDGNKTIGTPNKKMWGIFYEEINHGGEGGLYAELIRNRNFAESNAGEGSMVLDGKILSRTCFQNDYFLKGKILDENSLPGWSVKAMPGVHCMIEKTEEAPRNPACPEQLHLMTDGPARLVNGGFWGISAKKQQYRGFMIAKSENIKNVTFGLMRKDGTVLGQCGITGIDREYKKFEISFACETANTDARAFIEIPEAGSIVFDFVSLFPEDAEDGFRKDILDMLRGMKPGFLRFPGGCVVEGVTLDNAIHWKNSIGAIEDRPGHWNLWGYRFTDGLGMLEYCKLGEKLGADLMYVCNCGISCQARKPEFSDEEETKFWLQNALDGIEYICGGTDTKWGALRAQHGHPEPFDLKYVEIGNENNGDKYFERYFPFYNAIREKYPQLQLIADMRVPGAEYDLVDDHYYTMPLEFPQMCKKYSGEGEKVYVGEYACNSDVGYGNLLSAVSEACFMTHMENCCDRVRIASYAPLLCNENDRNWPVNLINFDRNSVFGIPSYYVQRLFSVNAVERVVYNDCDSNKLFVTAGYAGKELVIKAANFDGKAQVVRFFCNARAGEKHVLHLVSSENKEDTNSLLYPENVSETRQEITACEGYIDVLMPAWSFAVIR